MLLHINFGYYIAIWKCFCTSISKCYCTAILKFCCSAILNCYCPAIMKCHCTAILKCYCTTILKFCCSAILNCYCPAIMKCYCTSISKCYCTTIMSCSRQSPRALEAGLLQRSPCQSTGLYSGSTVRCDASCCQSHPPTASQRSGVRCHPSPAPLARHLGAGPFQTVRARVPLYPWNSSFLPIEVLCSGQLDRRTITPPFSRIWRSVHSRDEHCYHWSAGICGRLSRCMEQSTHRTP